MHVLVRELGFAIDASLRREAAVRFDDEVRGYAGASLQAVNVLGEELEEQALLREQGDEGVRDGGGELSGVQLLGQDVEWLRVLAEVGDVKDGLGVGQI
jgi:hypothetical protein